jgi:hypothetical protein
MPPKSAHFEFEDQPARRMPTTTSAVTAVM